MKTLNRGMLISLEGVDGSGKTTLAQGLYSELLRAGYPVLLTGEPGGTPLGKQINQLVQFGSEPVSPLAEFLLFSADRAHHIATVVKPALQQNMIVISDRLADSSLAYQGYGRGLDIGMIEQINAWAMGGLRPDVTVYVAIDIETALSRLAQRKKLTTIERQKRDFFERVIRGFEALFHARPDVVRVEGTEQPEVLNAAVMRSVVERL